MKIYSIYKATNKNNGKSYIGFTGQSLRIRKYQHLRDSRFSECLFYHAIRKYGWETFEWEIICQSLDGNYLMTVMEPYFIEYYDSFKTGYNMTKGGDKGPSHLGKKRTEETKQKMRFKALGRRHTDETKQRLRKHNLGKTYGKETKEKVGAASAMKWQLVNLETGNISVIFNLRKFCRENRLTKRSKIHWKNGYWLKYKGNKVYEAMLL
jgi:group I intron endonuclease